MSYFMTSIVLYSTQISGGLGLRGLQTIIRAVPAMWKRLCSPILRDGETGYVLRELDHLLVQTSYIRLFKVN